jgi:hypothetical protein
LRATAAFFTVLRATAAFFTVLRATAAFFTVLRATAVLVLAENSSIIAVVSIKELSSSISMILSRAFFFDSIGLDAFFLFLLLFLNMMIHSRSNSKEIAVDTMSLT